MIRSLLFAALALPSVAVGADSLTVDLDGDGEKEQVRWDSSSGTVFVGKLTAPCDGEPCTVEVHDITSSDEAKQLEVCSAGPRDDRYCYLYSLKGGKLVRHDRVGDEEDYGAPELRTSGNGIVLAVDSYRYRLYERIEKYRLKGDKLVETRQPLYLAETPKKLYIDRTFKLLYAPDSSEAVANTRPGSDILVLGEHGEKDGWLLVRLSSGVSGWVNFEALMKASNQYMQVMGAG
jgi:hypothetical protein